MRQTGRRASPSGEAWNIFPVFYKTTKHHLRHRKNIPYAPEMFLYNYCFIEYRRVLRRRARQNILYQNKIRLFL
jgi:hypothetical protein